MSETRSTPPWSYFLAACEHRSLTAAAQQLGLSQPALTQAIGRLEQMLGVSLFDRSTRPMSVTAYGETVRRYALSVERGLADLERDLAAMREGTGGVLRFGCGPDWVNEILPDAISRMNAEAPDLRFDMRVTLNDDLRAMLDAGTIDFFFASMGDAQFGPDYATRILQRDTMLIVARRGHALTRGEPASLDALHEAQWVMTGPATYGHQALLRLFGDGGVQVPAPVVQTNSVRAMVNIVRRSDMLGFLSDTHAGAYPDLVAVPLAVATPERAVGVTWRRDRPLLPAAERLVEACRGG